MVTSVVPMRPRCQEASIYAPPIPLPPGKFIACGAPAHVAVHWPHRKEGPYWMCEACADHNLRRRGASVFVPWFDHYRRVCCGWVRWDGEVWFIHPEHWPRVVFQGCACGG